MTLFADRVRARKWVSSRAAKAAISRFIEDGGSARELGDILLDAARTLVLGTAVRGMRRNERKRDTHLARLEDFVKWLERHSQPQPAFLLREIGPRVFYRQREHAGRLRDALKAMREDERLKVERLNDSPFRLPKNRPKTRAPFAARLQALGFTYRGARAVLDDLRDAAPDIYTGRRDSLR